MEVFTLLISINQECKKCYFTSTCIIIGRENELIGFFCQKCGEEYKEMLENNYAFKAEQQRSKMQKLRKKIRKEKERQSLLQLAVQISLLDSEAKEKLVYLINKIRRENISNSDIRM